MARKFLVPIDLSKLELQNAAVHNLASDPASPALGQIYYNTSSNRIKVKGASAFLEIPTSGTIANADIASGAAIAYSKLSLTGSVTNSDLAGSISNDKLATNPLARANHTGTQTASTISDFDTQVRTSRLDQMASPTASVSFNSQKITGLAEPTSSSDAATKNYVDNAVVGIDWKPSARALSTSNITLSGTQTIDGVALSAGDRVLVAGQTTGSQDGIYVVAAGSWTRSTDCASGSSQNAFAVFIEEGTTYADTGWVLTNNGTVTIGTTDLTFTQFSSAGTINAGNGLTKSGSTLHVGDGTSYAVGDLLYASSGTALSKLAAVATGNVLISGGVTTAPSWGKVGLTTHVSGTLAVGNGGTGLATTPSNGQLLIGNGTNYTLAGLSGTTNQVTVTNGSGTITLSLPQSIHTAATPQFAGIGIGGTAPATGITVAAGKVTLITTGASSAPLNMATGTTVTSPASGDIWVTSDTINYRTSGAATKVVAFTDSSITGTSAGISGTQTANYVYAAPNGSTGTGSFRALVAADIPSLDAAKITSGTLASARGGALRYASDVGDGTSTSIAVTHSLSTYDVVVNVYDKTSGATVECDVTRTSTTVVTLAFATAPTAAQYRVVVLA